MKNYTIPGLIDPVTREKEIARGTYLGAAIAQHRFKKGLSLAQAVPAYTVKVLVGPDRRLAYEDKLGACIYRVPGELDTTYDLMLRLDLQAIGLGRNDYLVVVEGADGPFHYSMCVVGGENRFTPGAQF